jgi:glycosyltransferase involved in cell wall biosynthesis
MTETVPIGGADPPRFSIVVPTYGRPEFLRAALASVQCQTEQDFECIVVDDASPEPVTVELPDARFVVVRRHDNGGPAAARNTGLRRAQGHFVVFLDDDDEFTPNRLSLAAAGLALAPIAVCGAGTVGVSDSFGYGLDGPVGEHILDATTPHLGATAVRREHCLEFDERYRACEDLDWWLRMAVVHPVTSTNEVGWLWRRHDADRGSLGPMARIAGSRQMLDDHADYFASHPRAAAFRWYRIGRLAAEVGDARLRRAAARRMMSLDRRPATVARALRLWRG